MPDTPIGTGPGTSPAGQIPVSPNNPCPFLRALVANGYVGGHVVPLSQLSEMIGLASGETGSAQTKVRLETRMVAGIANGLGPLSVLKSVISGALLAHAGSLKAVYESLGISRKTLYEKMQRYGLDKRYSGQE